VQSLLAIQLNLQMMQDSHKTQDPVDYGSLDRVVEEIRTAGDELRRVSHDLRPEAMERLELAEAIRSHAKRLEQGTGLKIAIEAQELVVATHLKDNLYRIYQEALLNAVKHAAAQRVDVRLHVSAGRIVMNIADDGRGFQREAKGDGRFGVGLTTIRERAELLGGKAAIVSSPEGTRITINVPLHSQL
jgi:two-component system NarL family sensor kinase